ncbi:MAG: GTP-binding protein, partial [Synergistaceae bacterium]|nr:GTP-binding protein [Synergistaceae bacterium]
AGCVCCTLKAKLQAVLENIYSQSSNAYVLIEPSGVGQLSDVISACELAGKLGVELSVRHRIVVVDASSYFDYYDGFGDFYMDQVRHASLIVFSHVKDISEAARAKLFDAVREANHNAVLYQKDWFSSESVGLELVTLLDSLEPECLHENHEHSHNHEHEDEQILNSFSFMSVKDFASLDEIKDMLSALKNFERYGEIFRAKGLVKLDNKIFKFDFTPYHDEVKELEACNLNLSSRAVIIGRNLNEAALNNLFKF